ncbi:MAG: hypothetical protein P8M62_04745 [Opitutae bacterium]|jgi:hypothetical protein|nr:hypothetical protein [Opitutae bacterium]
MNIFKKLFGGSPPPSSTSEVFVKWDENAKEYGPYVLGDLMSKSWSGPPKIGKLSGERKWRPYSEVFALLEKIEPSEKQRAYLEKLQVSIETTSYLHAYKLIDHAKKKKKEAAGKLPATKATLKKLKEHGIKHSESITRAEAKALLEKKDDKDRKDELLATVKASGIQLPSRVTLEELEELEYASLPSEESLAELNKMCQTLDVWKVKYKLPKIYTQDSVDDTIDTYDEAINEAESAVDEIKQGFLELENGDYGLEGVAEDSDFTELMADIAKRVFKENWEFEKNLRSMLRKHFPDAKFEKID